MKIKSMNELKMYAKEIYRDDDGIWVILKKNYCTTDEAHTIHGDTVKEILEEAKNIKFTLGSK